MGKFIRGDRSYKVPLIIAERTGIYTTERLLERLRKNRNNVILLKNKQGMVRIYGSGDTQVLEVQIGKKKDLKVYHMLNDLKTELTDSIVPVTDDTPIVIENKWHEKFPVRRHWLVNEENIDGFLTELYSAKDLHIAMDYFSFEDTTEEINRLIEEKVHIVPEIPVDWPVGGLESKMGQEWMRRKEDRVQRAIAILSTF